LFDVCKSLKSHRWTNSSRPVFHHSSLSASEDKGQTNTKKIRSGGNTTTITRYQSITCVCVTASKTKPSRACYLRSPSQGAANPPWLPPCDSIPSGSISCRPPDPMPTTALVLSDFFLTCSSRGRFFAACSLGARAGIETDGIAL